MLSSLANFLPSALHINNSSSDRDLKRAAFNADDGASDDEDDSSDPAKQGQQEKNSSNNERQSVKSKEKEKAVNETFIIVRPPPSKSNHPLNLQVQLVPPNTRPPTGVTPSTSEFGTANTPTTPNTAMSTTSLARTSSTRSNTSAYSTYGSTASISSLASTSTSTSTSARRTIIPLYNLQAHNVLTNVIVDAGTDAKIAKFQKRGIELIDLAMLEPVEVWGEPGGAAGGYVAASGGGRNSTRASVDEQGYAAPGSTPNAGGTRGSAFSARSGGVFLQPGGSRPTTPSATSSAVSLQSSNHVHAPSHTQTHSHLNPANQAQPTHLQAPELITTEPSPVSPKRNIFGKLFNKKPSTSIKDASPSSPSFSSFRTPPSPSGSAFSPGVESPNVTPRVGSGHARNLSLGASIATPLKALKNNTSNRLSAVITSESERGRGRSPSPNPSALSGTGTTESIESNSLYPVQSTLSATAANSNLVPTHGQMESIKDREKEKHEKLQLRPPVLGIQPTFVSSSVSTGVALAVATGKRGGGSDRDKEGEKEGKGERALMYVWLVRRWMKKREGEGILGGLNLNLNLNIGQRGNGIGGQNSALLPGGLGGVEVRFEWKRARAKGKKGAVDGEGKRGRAGRRRASARSTGAGRAGEDEDEEGVVKVRDMERERTQERGKRDQTREREEKKKNRLSTTSFSTTVTSEEGRGEVEEDDGNESDPEDSETPWVCTLKIRRSASLAVQGPSFPPSSSAASSPFTSPRASTVSPPGAGGAGAPQTLKIKVGTLSPTPHHPKVVAMLKVPFPLPDVEVERMGVVRRRGAGSRDGEEDQQQQQPYMGTTLTAEEIKDVVCSTGLWLVVREGFGGVGRVSRKGDGWRIRA
ncbi:hypothetical protein BDQ12DRAFT_654852 [Crucibulum laeve]|uniref:Uncharacterized protein n=1 Tax=Crucibulum laeve TaxID=68775 RepID=A0A5C3LTE4_9AGAR|nr:hypothetical protein BDQ12DRAFT_654852 [Crucibulum laeve]